MDAATGVVSKLEFTREYEYLQYCDDIMYMNKNVVCLIALYAKDRYGVYEFKNGVLTDSLLWANSYWAISTNDVLIYGEIC